MLNTKFSPWPSFTPEEGEAVKHVLLSNKVNYWTGTECREFEKEFALFADSQYAVAVANGTVALDLALKALKIGQGDEVIVTPRTFLASVSSIITAGATPIFADVDKDSQNITAETIEKVISPKTKAVICVHLAGWPCDMDPILALAKRHDLRIIEDCAQAHGARYKGKSVGSFGDVSAWSFCQDKIMTTGGEGGMVTTNNKDLWAAMWSYKDHGKSWVSVYEKQHPAGFRWVHDDFGTNWRMMEMQGVIGRIQLKHMPQWTKKRNDYAHRIWITAKQFPFFRVPEIPSDIVHAAYKCYIFVKPDLLPLRWTRDKVISEINAAGVPCLQGSCSEVYLEHAFDHTHFKPKTRLSVAKELGETSLMFLVHPTLTDDEINQTCAVLTKVGQLLS